MNTSLRQRLRMTWTARNVAIWGSVLVVPSIAAVFLIGKQPAHVELEWALGLFAGFLFVFLTAGLYGGTRWRKGKADAAKEVEQRRSTAEEVGIESVKTGLDAATTSADIGLDLGGDEGCLVAVIGAIVAVIVVFLLGTLGYFFSLWGLEALAVLVGGGTWVLYRAFRRVFLFSRQCEGQLGKSAAHALAFTALYTGGGFALLYLLRVLV